MNVKQYGEFLRHIKAIGNNIRQPVGSKDAHSHDSPTSKFQEKGPDTICHPYTWHSILSYYSTKVL